MPCHIADQNLKSKPTKNEENSTTWADDDAQAHMRAHYDPHDSY